MLCPPSTTDPVAVYLSKRCCVKPRSEMALHGVTNEPPPLATTAIIEPHIVTGETFQSSEVPQACNRLIVERTACTWSAVNKAAMVRVANQSIRHVQRPRIMLLEYVTPVTNEPTEIVSATSQVEQYNTDSALKCISKNNISQNQRSQVLDLCAKYRSVLSLSRQELGCRTIG